MNVQTELDGLITEILVGVWQKHIKPGDIERVCPKLCSVAKSVFKHDMTTSEAREEVIRELESRKPS